MHKYFTLEHFPALSRSVFLARSRTMKQRQRVSHRIEKKIFQNNFHNPTGEVYAQRGLKYEGRDEKSADAVGSRVILSRSDSISRGEGFRILRTGQYQRIQIP